MDFRNLSVDEFYTALNKKYAELELDDNIPSDIQFAVALNLLPKDACCENCCGLMILKHRKRESLVQYRCTECRKWVSSSENTFKGKFGNFSWRNILQFIYLHYACTQTNTFLAIRISSATAVDWSNYIREIMMQVLLATSVQKRNRESLNWVKQNFVESGSVIITDEWKGYSQIEDLQNINIKHLSVNHSKYFVDPISGANTQSIDSLWGFTISLSYHEKSTSVSTRPRNAIMASAVARRLGKLLPNNAALFLCDMQEKFRPTIQYFPQIVEISNRMLRAAKLLDIPVVVTEQYPKGLGPTVKELGIDQFGLKPFPKLEFSMVQPEVEEYLKKQNRSINSIILCGIEAHVCIQNTALSLLEKNYDVHVVVDACSSRSLVDRMYAFERLKASGCFLTTSESVVLGLVCGSHHPKFKEAQKIIWDSAPDTGLLHLKPSSK